MTDQDVRRIEDKVDGLAIGFARLEGSLAPTLSKLTDRQDDQEAITADHERRIRALERFCYAWPSVALIAAAAAVGTLIYYLSVGG